MDIGVALVAIVAGCTAGSIINMLASRLPADGDPPMVGPPFRPNGGQPDSMALIPLFGAWMPAVRAVDWPKLGTDIAAIAMAFAAFSRHDLTLSGARAFVFGAILLLILRIDWQHHLIFSIIIVPAILVALVFQALAGWDRLLWAVIAGVGAAALFLFLYVLAVIIYKQRALGFGDVLLAGLIGVMTGRAIVVALIFGMFLAAVGGLFLIAIRVRKRTDYIPYGAYLCLGALVIAILAR